MKMEYLNLFLCVFAATVLLDARANASGNVKEATNDAFTDINKTSGDTYTHVEKTHSRDSDIFKVVQSTLEPRIKMFMDREFVTSFNYTLACQDLTSNYELAVTSENPKVLRVPETSVFISCANATLIDINRTSHVEAANSSYVIDGSFDVKLMSGLIGYDTIMFQLSEETDANETRTEETDTYDVVVIRKMRPVDRIFRIAVYCMQIFTLVGFGSKLDLKVVKESLRRPIAPGIGFCCQYIMMPLVSPSLGTGSTTKPSK